MARESDGPSETALHTVCPRHCRTRQGADQVDWAGLPVNLDLAFSQNQRDKVYAQHLKFERAGRFRRRAQDVCICDMVDHPELNADTRKSASGW
ncbi:MAG: hypothetical protein CK429_32185 [Mycobacterium sp.]|nr:MULTISPECIES: hypothetical protein [Mycobacterium]MBI2700582.1 hypothetical protein [Mycobacterium sp.]MCQ4362169.1 hypothetical protein [Mycobacterium gordonae]MCV7009340.1 hypothetical protein [Mycobacterium gordonae]PJE04102.1 MAG: hypothetical protein CK429_32185 [Mycobacterium sp.]PJE04773.1 MAG: hypothetical protein CK428_27245 [Mycobacterium sp.]